MSWVFGVVAVALAVLFAWGLIAPRSQWRALAAWSVSDPFAHEPGGSGYAVRRLISGLGILGLAAVVIIGSAPAIADQFKEPPAARTPVEVMWGSPTPHLVARVVRPATAPPEGLVAVPVLGYQVIDRTDDLPTYLISLTPFSLLGRQNIPGYIGTLPEVGFSAYSQADLLVNVRGSVLCIPRQAVAIETDTTVQVAIYYGLPDPADGSTPDNATACPPGDPLTSSVLIPLVLSAPIGTRTVQTLDGEAVPRVRVVD